MPGSLSLTDLHDVLQVAVGWTDSHLHQFVARGTLYGRPDPEFGRGCVNEKGVRLDGVLRAEKDAMTYEYDFGDGWQHKVVLEKILGSAVAGVASSCTAGARACPPKDCGGVWRYANLLKIISDSSHPEHEEKLEWLGDQFEPERFDIVIQTASWSKTMFLHVVEARYVRGHVVWLKFSDGAAGEIDLAAELDGPVFEPLRSRRRPGHRCDLRACGSAHRRRGPCCRLDGLT